MQLKTNSTTVPAVPGIVFSVKKNNPSTAKVSLQCISSSWEVQSNSDALCQTTTLAFLLWDLRLFQANITYLFTSLAFGFRSSPPALLTSSVTLTDNAAWLCRDYRLTSCLGPFGNTILYHSVNSQWFASAPLHVCLCVQYNVSHSSRLCQNPLTNFLAHLSIPWKNSALCSLHEVRLNFELNFNWPESPLSISLLWTARIQ